jgi:hypothetical protein
VLLEIDRDADNGDAAGKSDEDVAINFDADVDAGICADVELTKLRRRPVVRDTLLDLRRRNDGARWPPPTMGVCVRRGEFGSSNADVRTKALVIERFTRRAGVDIGWHDCKSIGATPFLHGVGAAASPLPSSSSLNSVPRPPQLSMTTLLMRQDKAHYWRYDVTAVAGRVMPMHAASSPLHISHYYVSTGDIEATHFQATLLFSLYVSSTIEFLACTTDEIARGVRLKGQWTQWSELDALEEKCSGLCRARL